MLRWECWGCKEQQYDCDPAILVPRIYGGPHRYVCEYCYAAILGLLKERGRRMRVRNKEAPR